MHYYVFMSVVVDRSHEFQFNAHLPSHLPTHRSEPSALLTNNTKEPHHTKTLKNKNYKNHKQNKLCTSVRLCRCYSRNLITASFARIAHSVRAVNMHVLSQRIPSIHSCEQLFFAHSYIARINSAASWRVCSDCIYIYITHQPNVPTSATSS